MTLKPKASRGRFGIDKANEIQQTAKNSFGIVLASSSFSLIIRQYLEQLKSLETSIAIFDAEIARLMAGFDTKLETITGVGITLVAVIFSEIGGDIRKFSSLPKLVLGFILNLVSRANPKPMGICPNAVLLICDALFGLPLPLLLLRILPLVFSIRKNAPRGKTI